MPTMNPDTLCKSVRGLTRGLDLLMALNALKNGHETPTELSHTTGQHLTTVRSLPQT